jgi:hypothetical protein
VTPSEAAAIAETVPATFFVVFLLLWGFAMLSPLFGRLSSSVRHDRTPTDTSVKDKKP